MEDHEVQRIWKGREIYEMKKIDAGSYGQVYKGFDLSQNRIVALKHIKHQYWQKEVEMLKNLSHPVILKYYDHFLESEIEGKKQKQGVYILTEFVDGGTLREVLEQNAVKNKGLPEDTVLTIFKQLIDGFNYMHQKKIVHRDIKPDNILIFDQHHAKIIDLGQSKQVALLQTMEQGTPLYNAPEVFTDQNPQDLRRDVWSLGMVLYEMLMGQNIYHQFLKANRNNPNIVNSLKKYVIEGKLQIKIRKDIDDFWYSLLKHMLQKNYKKRKHMNQIKLLFQNQYEGLKKRVRSRHSWKNIKMPPEFHLYNQLFKTKNQLEATTNYTNLCHIRKYLSFFYEKHKFLIVFTELLQDKKFPSRYPFLPKMYKIVLIFLAYEIYLASIKQMCAQLGKDIIRIGPQEKYNIFYFEEPYRSKIEEQINAYLEFYLDEAKFFAQKMDKKVLNNFNKSFECFSKPIYDKKTLLETTKTKSTKSRRITKSISKQTEITEERIEQSGKTLSDFTELDVNSKLFNQFPILLELLSQYKEHKKLEREQYIKLFKDVVSSGSFTHSFSDLEKYFYAGDLAIYYLMRVIGDFDSFYQWKEAKNGGYLLKKDFQDIEGIEKLGRKEKFLEKIKNLK